MAKTDPFRERKWYTMGTGAIISLILALIIPVPFVISMLHLKVYVPLGAYAATYLFLVFIVASFVRRSRLNAYHIVDPTIIEKTVNDLQMSRIAAKSTFTATEIGELFQGKKIPVLDVLKTDPQLRSRHSFFSRIAHLAIDPQKKEMELLIQLPAIIVSEIEDIHAFRKHFYSRIAGFLKILASETRCDPYKEFFSTLILECDGLREDAQGYDLPVPVFSMEFPSDQLWKLSTLHPYQELPLASLGDVRFSNGVEIEPHRVMRS